MRKNILVTLVGVCLVLAATGSAMSQTINGAGTWVNNGNIRLYVWEKYMGSPAGKPIVVLCHGSATAGKESFDLQVPGKATYSLMDVLARAGFDVFAPDVRGFGRSTHPEGLMTTMEASLDLNAVVDYILKREKGLKGLPSRLVLGYPVRRDARDGATRQGREIRLVRADAPEQPRHRQEAAAC